MSPPMSLWITLFTVYYLLVEGPGVAREKKMLKMIFFITYNTPRPPLSVHKKNFRPIGPAIQLV